MAHLSISTAWDETRAVIARDRRLLVSVALALVGLPSMVVSLFAPGSMMPGLSQALWMDVLALVAMIFALAGQLALARLALQPPITVGESIGHAFRRVPVYLGSTLILAVGIVIVVIPVLMLMSGSGESIVTDVRQLGAGSLTAFLIFILVVLALIIRLIQMTPVAAAEPGGSLHIIKRSWQLSQGHWLKLTGFLLVFFVGAFVLIALVSMIIGALIMMALGSDDQLGLATILKATLEGLLNAGFSMVFSVMLARIYVQLSGRSRVDDALA